MILAAGMGTRLRPLTDYCPKALTEINGISLLERVITKLINQGITGFTVNVHHFSEQIVSFLNQKQHFGAEINISDESGVLLDSGGGILKASSFFPENEDILIHNVDILTDLDLQSLFDYHLKNKALATLAVRDRATSRYFLFDDGMELVGWRKGEKGTGNRDRGSGKEEEEMWKVEKGKGNRDRGSGKEEEEMWKVEKGKGNRDRGSGNRKVEVRVVKGKAIENSKPLAFSGVYILSPEFPGLITEGGKFSILDVFLRLAADYKITGYRHDLDFWMDVGKVCQLEEAERMLMNQLNLPR
ncbi:MAG: sugar phosphate nucleotidyltransferase [Bacteroidetes bacterium]|nr:sugar phosphate nucleotidyltransferase [Bacteroidota bacterium]